MSAQESIMAAYLLSALLIGGLVVASWVRARRVRRALAAQDTTGRA